MVYRTPAIMPPQEKKMRYISKDEKHEKSSSIESFRAVQVLSFIVAGLCLGVAALKIMQLTDAVPASTVADHHAWSIALGVIALGGLVLSLGATRRISKLQPYVEAYWEQCSERATNRETH